MSEYHVMQLNVAGSNARMHALLNEPLYDNFSIFIFQDPWWGRIGSKKSLSSSEFNIYGPDIYEAHQDILAIDIEILNSKSTIINAYPHGKNHKQTINNITNINIPRDRPVIMAGDFNIHHPDWAIPGSKWVKKKPDPTAREFATYAEYNDLHIMNDFTFPTHICPNHPDSNSIIDLTLLNSYAVDTWENFDWEVEPQGSEKSLGSDHMAITWTIRPYDQDESVGVTEPSPRHTINPELLDDWVVKYSEVLEGEDIPPNPSSAEDADTIAGAILRAMSSATDAVMPKKKGNGPTRSPWWTEECSKAVHDLKHNPDHRTGDQLRAALRGAIRRAKKNRGEKILAEISTQKVFETLKWFEGKRRTLMPPIKDPTGRTPPATQPLQKAQNLANQFFVKESSPHITLDPLGIPEL
ncbi:endonuclease-reverse transcriptase, partial [Rhizoctonia solani 123E]